MNAGGVLYTCKSNENVTSVTSTVANGCQGICWVKAASLSARILATEHQAYPLALRRLLTEDWTVEGRRIVWLAAYI